MKKRKNSDGDDIHHNKFGKQNNEVILVDKPLGYTPLQAIKDLKEKYPQYKNEKMGYAGRLDPMARGLLILNYGEGLTKQKELELKKKVYEFEMLVGINTDTQDILGLTLSNEMYKYDSNEILMNIETSINKFVGKLDQPYPVYSSARVNGKPLFEWAKSNQLHLITIPSIKVEIYSLVKTGYYKITTSNLKSLIKSRIKLVSGNFRQEEILQKWETTLAEEQERDYIVIKFTSEVSSGTYIRSLCYRIGEHLGTGGIAFDINRTIVGDYMLCNAITLETNNKNNET